MARAAFLNVVKHFRLDRRGVGDQHPEFPGRTFSTALQQRAGDLEGCRLFSHATMIPQPDQGFSFMGRIFEEIQQLPSEERDRNHNHHDRKGFSEN